MDPLDYNQQTVTLESLEALPFSGQVVLTILYSATAIISFIGNSLVIIVLSLGNRLRVADMQMRTSVTSSLSVTDKDRTPSRPNFKVGIIKRVNSCQPVPLRNTFGQRDNLKSFLINLAWSDLAMSLFSIPFTYTDFLLGRWIFHSTLCRLASTINVVAITVSVTTMVLIGLDRYFAIVRPFTSSTSFVSRHSTLLIAVTWIFAILLASPQLLVTNVVPFQIQNETYYSCQEQWPSHVYSDLYSTLIILLTFVLPLCLLVIIYGKIVRRIANRDQNLFFSSSSNSHHNEEQNRSKSAGLQYRLRSSAKAIRMILTIVICFFVCWTPIQLFYFIIWTCRLDTQRTENGTVVNLYVCAFFAFHFLAVSHSAVNPTILLLLCENFQKSLRLIVNKVFTRQNSISSKL